MIIVTGASGQLGARVVGRLLESASPASIGVVVRDPVRVADLERRGVDVRRADFTDPSSLQSAFDGADQVLVVSVNGLGDAAVSANVAAIDAAFAAGTSRVLYTSHQAAAPTSPFPPARDHAAVEAHLSQTGRPFTALRNGYYASSLAFHLKIALDGDRLLAPADGLVAWTAREDLADAAAAVLTADRPIDGPTPPLTATSAVDFEGIADALSARTGRRIERVEMHGDDYVAHAVRKGVPEAMARMLLGTYEAARSGAFTATDPLLGDLIGREPETVDAVLATTLSNAGPRSPTTPGSWGPSVSPRARCTTAT